MVMLLSESTALYCTSSGEVGRGSGEWRVASDEWRETEPPLVARGEGRRIPRLALLGSGCRSASLDAGFARTNPETRTDRQIVPISAGAGRLFCWSWGDFYY